MKKFLTMSLALLLLALGWTVPTQAKTVYFQPSSNWLQDGARFALYMFTGTDASAWTDFAVVDAENNIYKATFDDSKTNMILCRMNPSTTVNSWDNRWNQSADLDAPASDNLLYTLADGQWDGASVGNGLTITNYTASSSGYLCDFNTPITTSDHAFQVASNWRHIVDSYENYYGGTSYASYTYSETAGVDGSGTLSCGTNQNYNNIYDLLVTPVVKGTVTIQAKTTAEYNSPLLEFYKITDNGDGTFTRGDKITVDVSAINPTDFAIITIPVDAAGERIGIRSSYVYLDNFTATEATIVPEKKIVFASAVAADGNSGTTGTIKWAQQANGNVLVSYTVKVTNTGEVDLAQGDEGFSISIINGGTGEVYGTTLVPQNLAIGETSEEFVVSAEVPTTLWPSTYTYVRMNLKENLFGSVLERAQSTFVAYESKFVVREAGSTSTTSLSGTQNWGVVNVGDVVSKSYEICNLGTAPMTLYVEGSFFPEDVFSLQGGKQALLMQMNAMDNVHVDLVTKAVTFDGGAIVPFTIVLNTENAGSFTGEVKAAYSEYGQDQTTYNCSFAAMVISPNTWMADFNNTSSAPLYPEGSVAEGGIQGDYNYNAGVYDNYLKGRTGSSYASANNMFITPKLHAAAGDQLTFDVKGAIAVYGNTTYYAKVFVSTDRKEWNQVAYYTAKDVEGAENIGYSEWKTKTVAFDTEGDYYVAFALYGEFAIDNIIGLEKVNVAHDLYIKTVNWPDASIKSGTAQTKPSVEFIPLTTEMASDYTVKYVYGETVLGEGEPVALTASANSSKTIAVNWTPQVDETTTYEGTKVVFEFTDGTKFETETFDLTVTNEAVFHFLNTKPSSKWYEPTDRTEPITFGKTNTADTQNFVIFNWGSADLTVNSISLPAGFSTTTEFPLTVVGFNGENDGIDASSQALDITFSATEPGDYSGDLVITYSGDKTFTLPISGTKLDPNKFYANFDNPTTNACNWPAGSVYQANINASTGNYSAPYKYYISSSSGTNNLFVTPKLVSAGEKIAFDAAIFSSLWAEGKVVVYAAATRDEVLNTEEGTTRTQLFSVSGEDAENPMTTDYQTFEVNVPAGEWYLGFEISGRPYVDEIYGLTVADVAHDWMIASSNIPTEAMQNKNYNASVNVLNLGLQDEAADAYTATLYVDGEAIATAEGVAIPMSHKLSDAGTQLSFNGICPKVGTFPVYIEVKAGDYSVATDPVDVTFTEEVATSDAIAIGSGTTLDYQYAIIDFYNFEQPRTSDIVYTAAQLKAFGLKSGDAISSLSFNGTVGYARSLNNFNLNAWVGMKTGDITWNSPDKSTMTEFNLFSGPKSFTAGEVVPITMTLEEPIVFDGESDLRIYFEGGGNNEYVQLRFAYDSNYKNMKWSNASSMKSNPVLYVTLASQSATLAGLVTNSAGAGIANASITLKAENGVEYSGTTDETGAYSMNVIQAGLDFTATVEAENYLTREFDYNLGGESKTLDVTLYQFYGIVGDAGMGLDWDNDVVMTQSEEDPMVFTAEVKNVEIVAGSYEYKLRTDGRWDTYQLPASGNQTAEFPADGVYNLTFTANVDTHELTLDIAVAEYILAEDAFENGNNPFVQTLPIAALTVERTFNEGWNAVVLPFVLTQEDITTTFGEGSAVAYFNGDIEDASGNVSVSFDKYEEDLAANKPYLIYVANAVSNPTFENKTLVDPNWAELKADVSGTVFDFMGTYTKINAEAGDMFISGGTFKTATSNNKVRAFRTYLKSKSQGARSVSIFIDGDEVSVATPTGIENASDDTTINGNVYNVNGQRVNKDVKHGVYIVNGKKVAVK